MNAITSKLINGGRRFHAFWETEIDPFVLGLFRFLLGLYLILYYIALGPDWLQFYGPSGISAREVVPLSEYSPFQPVFLIIHSDTGMWLFYGISLLSAIGFFCGALGKFPVIWLWISNFSIYHRNIVALNGEEQILGVLLFFAMLLPLNATFRMDQLLIPDKRKAMFASTAKIKTIALRPIQIQIALIYFISWPIKIISDPAWRDGTMVYYSMMFTTWPRWPGVAWTAWAGGLISKALTYYTLFAELFFPIFVWFKRFRLAAVICAMALQLGLTLAFEGLAFFTYAFFLGLILFLPSRQTKEFFARICKAEKAKES